MAASNTLRPAQPLNEDGTPVDEDWQPDWELIVTVDDDKHGMSVEARSGKNRVNIPLDIAQAELFAGHVGALSKTLEPA